MITSLRPALGVQALADTLVTVQARGTLETVTDLAVIVLAVALSATIVWLALFLRRLSGFERAVRGAVRRAGDSAGPLLERSSDVADNLEFITRALRTDVERLHASVRALAERLGQASDRMEERIEEFNALIEVVQSEAEAIFIDTASTVRGVRAGARTLGAADDAEPPGTPGGTPGGMPGAPRVQPGAEGTYLTGETADVEEDPERRKEA